MKNKELKRDDKANERKIVKDLTHLVVKIADTEPDEIRPRYVVPVINKDQRNRKEGDN